MNYNSLKRKVYELFRENKKAKTQEQRNRVIYKHLDLLDQLQSLSESLDSAEGGTDPDNHYQHLINRVGNWITNGSGDKDYKAKLKPDHPSEIRPNMKTNDRIYHGKSNYYTSYSIKPTKSELKDPDVKQQVINLKYCHSLLKRKDKNRYSVSTMIHEQKQDLIDTLNSKRGTDHTGRKDNEPSPVKYDVIDQIDLKDALNNNKALHAYYDGYTEQEISDNYGIPRSTVSLIIRSAVSDLVNS